MKVARYLLILMAACSLLLAADQKKPASKAAAPAAASTASKGALLDINSASEQELKQLPGIGDAYAGKIVQNRPYRAKNQLVQKNIIPAATYDKIKDQIIAKQATGAAAKKK